MLKTISTLILTLLMTLNTVSAETLNNSNVPKKKQTQAGLYLNSIDAHEILKKEANKILFLDVRTRGEIAYTGMPTAADSNVPFKFTSKKYKWIDKKSMFGMTPNPNFVEAATQRLLQKGLNKNDKVFVMCRSGGRSAKAADALTAAGFTQVFSIIDGYEGDTVKEGDKKGKRTINGWKNSNLAWSFALNKDKMYLESKEKDKDDKSSKMLEKMDTNNDNTVSESEFKAFHKKMFGNIDHNHNGILDEAELAEFKKQKKLKKEKEKQEKANSH
ncbi:MAG: hypothetical protein KAH20_10015 [Methylococcales bacterium]|nr:hypothetical protein [Methylococcales bacterium]